MKRQWVLAITLILGLMLSACAAPQAPAADSGAAAGDAGSAAAPAGGTTFVGTPRNETLILDNLGGSLERPENFNMYTPGVEMGRGYHELCTDHLWDIDTTTGEQFGSLAADLPKAERRLHQL